MSQFWDKVGVLGRHMAGKEGEYQKTQLLNRELEQKRAKEREQEAAEQGRRALLQVARMAQDPNQITQAQGALAELSKQFEGTRTGELFGRFAQTDALKLPGLLQGEIQDLQALGELETGGQAKFSATTVPLPDGGAIQYDNTGRRVVVDRSGNQLTDPEQTGAYLENVFGQDFERKVDIAGATTAARENAKGQSTRSNEVIDMGILAARQMPVLKRTRALLNMINTGGFSGAALKAQQWLGIEGADEGELTTNMARNVLSQLRTVFGAQFTEREGARLERVEANIGKSTEANKRNIEILLQLADIKVDQAVRRATQAGDAAAVMEIREYTNMNLGDESGMDIPDPRTPNDRVIDWNDLGDSDIPRI